MRLAAFLLVVLAASAALKVSAGATKIYSAQCLDGSSVTVKAPDVGILSKYKDYKVLVCAECAMSDCKETRLFKGFSKKHDGDRIKNTGNLNDLTLKKYGSDEREVSYKCPGARDVQHVSCYTSQSMKQCLTTECEQCRDSNCEVYAGTAKVSSGKVAVSGGVYQVDTKASKSEILKQSLDKIKKFATSDTAKGLTSSIGAAILNNKDRLLQLSKSMGISDEAAKKVDQIIRLGDSFYAKDVGGGLRALVELTGRPLSEEEEEEIGRNLKDGDVDYSKLSSVIEEERRRVLRDKDLHQESVWDKHGTYILLGGAVVAVACFASCVICCYLCMRQKPRATRALLHELSHMQGNGVPAPGPREL